MNRKQTSKSVASLAGKVLRNRRSTKTLKTLAATALAQTRSGKGR